MFCENCKDYLEDSNANYCKYCGTKLINVDELEIPSDQVTVNFIMDFLKNVLGYEIVKDEGGWIEAKYRDNGLDDKLDAPIIIFLNDLSIYFFVNFNIKINISNDLRFFKCLNKANRDTTFVKFQYIEPNNDDDEEINDDYGEMRIGLHIIFSNHFPLHSLYLLAKNSFVSTAFTKAIEAGFVEYFGFTVLFKSIK